MIKRKLFGLSTVLSAGLFIFLTACGGPEEDQADGTDGTAEDMQEQPQEQPQQPPQQQQPQDMDIDVSSEEVETFADVLGEIEELQAGLEGDMDEILEDEGMDMQRYQELMMQQQGMAEEGDAPEMTDEEQQQMQNAQERLQTLQQGMEDDAIAIMEEKGMSYERYQEIQMAVQQDPELQQELMEHLDHEGGQPQQPPQGR